MSTRGVSGAGAPMTGDPMAMVELAAIECSDRQRDVARAARDAARAEREARFEDRVDAMEAQAVVEMITGCVQGGAQMVGGGFQASGNEGAGRAFQGGSELAGALGGFIASSFERDAARAEHQQTQAGERAGDASEMMAEARERGDRMLSRMESIQQLRAEATRAAIGQRG